MRATSKRPASRRGEQARGVAQLTWAVHRPAMATATQQTDFTQRIDIETPELVVLSYTIAGVGSRVYAGLIDLMICVAIFFGIVLGSSLVMARLGTGPIATDTIGAWAGAILVLLQRSEEHTFEL